LIGQNQPMVPGVLLALLVSLVSSRRRVMMRRFLARRGGPYGDQPVPERPPPPRRPAGVAPALQRAIPEDQKDKSTPVPRHRPALAKSGMLELLASLLSVAGAMAVVAIMFFVGRSLLTRRGPRDATLAGRPLLVAE
jgi:hypothetical protein